MTTITAKSVLASTNGDSRIDTMLLRYPRCIHAEFMTHRQFSRSASSSRAVPVAKLIQDVLDDPFVPLHWGKNQKGMQASEECNNKVMWPLDWDNPELGTTPVSREASWLRAMKQAVRVARAFDEAGYHKQIVNRLLEPFSHIIVVVTATEWDNFFALRDHPDAEPHIQMLAQAIRKARDEAEVQKLEPGDWHLPFVYRGEATDIWLDKYSGNRGGDNEASTLCMNDLIKLSVARCASTSYKTVEGFDMTLDRAIALHDKLAGATPAHASPMEHQAKASFGSMTSDALDGWNGNLGLGWQQYRKLLEMGNGS